MTLYEKRTFIRNFLKNNEKGYPNIRKDLIETIGTSEARFDCVVSGVVPDAEAVDVIYNQCKFLEYCEMTGRGMYEMRENEL